VSNKTVTTKQATAKIKRHVEALKRHVLSETKLK